tara:strand:+ start:996 stop:1247 length:252 start_codon:yes stop_codon:yes gene_type:complete
MPDKAAIDVTIIGPKNQAKGILKYSAISELGIPIKKRIKNFLEISCEKFSLLESIVLAIGYYCYVDSYLHKRLNNSILIMEEK